MVTSGTKFTTKVLKKLLNTPNACVHLKKCRRHISLSPNALHDTKTSIREHLNQLITKFDPELGGVVLGCRNIIVLSRHGSIIYDSPDIHFDIDAEFYIFKPERGIVLTGIVKKTSRDNIGCLVHDIFNASIPIDVDNGVSSVDINNIYVGQPLTFTVEEVNFTDSLPYIRGKLYYSEEETQTIPSGRKRKRNDEHHPHKKMKTELKTSVNMDVNMDEDKYLNSTECNDLEHHDTVNMALKTFPKHCTSILKKGSSIGTESSPARRISFYGDVQVSSSRELTFMGENEENKTSKKAKKNKKESQISILETDSLLSTKKTITKEVGNDARGRKEAFVETTILETSVPMKEKKKKIKRNESTLITDGVHKKSEIFDMESFPSQSKKKSKNIYIDNINVRDRNDSERGELLGTNITLTQKVKKNKTKNEILSNVCQPENVDEADNLDLEDVTIHPEIKKCKSMIENEGQEYLEVEPEVDDSPLMQKAKKKKKRKKENESEELLNASLEKIDKVGSKGKKRTKKETSEKFGTDGFHENRKGTAGRNKVSSDLVAFPSISNQRTVNTALSSSAQIVPSIDNKNKKKKELINAVQREENVSSPDRSRFESAIDDYEKKKKKKKKKTPVDNGEMSYSSGVISKKKPAANSTVIVNTTPLTKKKKYDDKSDDSFESLSPIKKWDGHMERLDKELVTSTQIDRHCSTEISIEKKKKKRMTTTETGKEKLPITDFNSHAYVSDKTSLKDTAVTSESSGSNISSKETSKKFLQKTVDKHRSLKGTTTTQIPVHPFTVAASQSDSSSFSENITSPNFSSSKDKVLPMKDRFVETKSKKTEVITQKPAGSESSSSDGDVSSHVLPSIHRKTDDNGSDNYVQETFNIMSHHTDSSDGDDVVAAKEKQNVLPANAPHVNDSKRQSDSDLSSDNSIQKKLPLTVNMQKRNDKKLQNEFSSMKTFSTHSNFLSSKSASPPKKEVQQTLQREKNVKEEKSGRQRTKKNSHVNDLHPKTHKEIKGVTGRENVKSITPFTLNQDCSDVNSSDSDLPSNYNEIIAKQREEKEHRKEREKEHIKKEEKEHRKKEEKEHSKKEEKEHSKKEEKKHRKKEEKEHRKKEEKEHRKKDEKGVSESDTDSLVKHLLLKMKSEIFTPSEEI